jgi:hypothetical protein
LFPLASAFSSSSTPRLAPDTSLRPARGREPNGNVELDQNNYGSKAASWLPAKDFGVATLVTNGSYFDKSGKNVSINRGGMFDQYAVGVGGPANNFKPAVACELLGTERQKAPTSIGFYTTIK